MVPGKRNIVLVGFMGTGKTSVGKIVAQRLQMKFVDMDDFIVQRERATIPAIFEEKGEPYFRMLERKLVAELSAQSGLVIAPGGGIVINPDNIDDLDKTGLVVCLTATPEAIMKRVGYDSNRPLLAGSDRMKRIMNLMEDRHALYEAIPAQIDTTDQTIEQVADSVVWMYRAADAKQ